MTENNNNNFEYLIGEWSKNVYFLKRSTFANNDDAHTHTNAKRMRREKAEHQTKIKKSNGNIQTSIHSVHCPIENSVAYTWIESEIERKKNQNKNLYFDLFACFLAIHYTFGYVCNTVRGYFWFSFYF